MRYHIAIGHRVGYRTAMQISVDPPKLIPEGQYVAVPVDDWNNVFSALIEMQSYLETGEGKWPAVGRANLYEKITNALEGKTR